MVNTTDINKFMTSVFGQIFNKKMTTNATNFMIKWYNIDVDIIPLYK